LNHNLQDFDKNASFQSAAADGALPLLRPRARRPARLAGKTPISKTKSTELKRPSRPSAIRFERAVRQAPRAAPVFGETGVLSRLVHRDPFQRDERSCRAGAASARLSNG
jgi:hypothetical protein